MKRNYLFRSTHSNKLCYPIKYACHITEAARVYRIELKKVIFFLPRAAPKMANSIKTRMIDSSKSRTLTIKIHTGSGFYKYLQWLYLQELIRDNKHHYIRAY